MKNFITINISTPLNPEDINLLSFNIKTLIILYLFCKKYNLNHLKNHIDIITTNYLQEWHIKQSLHSSPKSSKNKPVSIKSPNKNTIHYISGSDSDPLSSPRQKPLNTPLKNSLDTFMHIINGTYYNYSPYHSPPHSLLSQSTEIDPFNHDYEEQYDQEFIYIIEQELYLQECYNSPRYDSDDLHAAYG